MDGIKENNFSFGKTAAVFLVVCFLIIIFLPSFVMFTHAIPEVDNQENRALSKWPEFSLWRILGSGWQREVDNYLNDRFGLRSHLVRANTKINLNWFGISPSDKVVLGKDGWLFYAAENAIDDYMAIKPFTEEQLQLIKQELEYRQNTLKEQGVEFLAMFVPDKHTIYPEFLPDTIHKVHDKTRLDQLTDYLHVHSNVKFVDVRQKFLEEKKDNLLYLKTDTHWNQYGSFIAYQELMHAINSIYPKVKPTEITNFLVKKYECKAGDLSALIFMREEMKDACVDLSFEKKYIEKDVNFASPKPGKFVFATESKDAYSKHVLVSYDSFFNAMRPYFSNHFERVAYVWDYDYHQYIVDEEKPDLVVLEMVERKLFYLLPKEQREY